MLQNRKVIILRRTLIGGLVLALVGVFVTESALAQPKVKAAATTGMVADLVRQVGDERVEVEHLMGPGVDPHLYKPTSATPAA